MAAMRANDALLSDAAPVFRAWPVGALSCSATTRLWKRLSLFGVEWSLAAMRAGDAFPVFRARGLSTRDGPLACSVRRVATACARNRFPLFGVLLALRIVADAEGNVWEVLMRDDGRLVPAARLSSPSLADSPEAGEL